MKRTGDGHALRSSNLKFNPSVATARDIVGVGYRAMRSAPSLLTAYRIFSRYRDFTMMDPLSYAHNILLAQREAPTSGCIIECGVWRGGMSAGLADALPGRAHFLFDS